LLQGMTVLALGAQVAANRAAPPSLPSLVFLSFGLLGVALSLRVRRGHAVATCFGALLSMASFAACAAWVSRGPAPPTLFPVSYLAMLVGGAASLAVPAAIPAAVRHSRDWHASRSAWLQW
jgi:hypothetical protein